MARDIHPACNAVQIKCSGCNNEFAVKIASDTGSLDVESCNKCHVAYTGIMTISQTGKVEQFTKKYGDIDWDTLA